MELARFFGFLHPALVHFPLVLLLVSVALEAIGFVGHDRRFTWAAQITLLVGTTATLFAFVAGNFAEVWAARDGIPQDPMEYHELLATITSWTFVFLTAARLFLGVGQRRTWMAAYLVAAISACILLGVTGHQGAMLVYNHGAGVHAAGLPPLATHEDMAVLLQKQDPDALFYSNKMHHVFGVMVMLLALMLLTDMISPRWGDRLRRFAPLLLLAGGVFLMIFSDQDAWPLYQVRPFRPWSDKEVLMHKTYAILMLAAGFRGFWQMWKARRRGREGAASLAAGTLSDGTRQMHARMMAIFALVGGGLLFTHVHSNAPYANVAAGVYIHHTVMGFIALCIGAVKLIEDALLQQRKEAGANPQDASPDLMLLDADKPPALHSAPSPRPASRLPVALAWIYPSLMLIESVFLLNYNEGLPWFLGYGNLALSAPHGGLIAPLGRDRAEFVYDPDTQRMDFYALNQGNNGLHSVPGMGAQALVKVGTDTTAVDLIPDVPTGNVSHFTAAAGFLRNTPLFQVQALVMPDARLGKSAPLVADFEPWVDKRLTAPHTWLAYVCPMHPAQGAAAPGVCPVCGMALTPNKPKRPWNKLHDDAYRIDFAMFAADTPRETAFHTQLSSRRYMEIRMRNGVIVHEPHHHYGGTPAALGQAGIKQGQTPQSGPTPTAQAGLPPQAYEPEGPHTHDEYFQAESETQFDTQTGVSNSATPAASPSIMSLTSPAAGQTVTLLLRPLKANGEPLAGLDVVHTKKMHLIIASRDLSFFDHVHPVEYAGGMSLDYVFPHGGDYVLYADCKPIGDRTQVFRIPVHVTGATPAPQPLVITPAQARVFGAYRVALTMTPDPPQINDETQLTFTVSKNGVPVTDIEPFLGAGGHCVILSEDTEGYLHSHPLEMGGSRFGPSVTFHAQFPRAGVYKIWGQFQHEGKPLIADFTVRVP